MDHRNINAKDVETIAVCCCSKSTLASTIDSIGPEPVGTKRPLEVLSIGVLAIVEVLYTMLTLSTIAGVSAVTTAAPPPEYPDGDPMYSV